MRYTTLGRSGTVVSTQTLGTMTFGAEADEPTSPRSWRPFVERGGTFLDTADVYSAGVSEEIIGRWLADHPDRRGAAGARDQGPVPHGPGRRTTSGSRGATSRAALEASLRRLGVEHIDLYQMHAWDAVTPSRRPCASSTTR